jgi:RNA polymerase sigma-70 factor, ECF subfamily
MKNSTDEAILERAKRFEAQTLEEIFDTYSQGIYRYAFRLLGDTDLARECMSETFSRFLHALKQEGGPDHYLQAYLYRVAHNWITDHYRSKTPPTLPLDPDLRSAPREEPHQIVVEWMENQQLRSALALLTPDQCEVITLKYLEDFENEDIAKALDKPIGAVKSLQHRALEALRRILNRHEEVDV